MKKVVSVLFVLMFLFNIFPIYISAKEELVRMNIMTDWSEGSFGVNVLKLLFDLAEDTDLLSIFSNTLTISEVTSDIYDYRLIIDNNGTEFARRVMA